MSLPTLAIAGNLAPIKGIPKKTLDATRPIDYIIDWIDKRMPTRTGAILQSPKSPADRILPIIAETGSGKSSFMIAEIFHAFYSRMRKNIAITQPRIVTAMEIPLDMLQYGTKEFYKKSGTSSREVLELGKNIGYQTGLFEKRPRSGMIYMTAQTLTQQLLILSDEEFMKKYMIIVIDEVHERSVASDMTMYLMKKFIKRNYKNPRCPFLILTSATFDANKFAKYFGVSGNVIKVHGAVFPIEEHFLDVPSDNVIASAVEKVRQVHIEYESDFKMPDKSKRAVSWEPTKYRDFIIFVPGMAHIRGISKGVHELNANDPFFKKHPVLVIELHGGVVAAKSEDYKNIFKAHSSLRFPIEDKIKTHPTRRIIISTSVAETGLTINTLKGVIDSGLQYSAEFNPLFNTRLLIQAPVAQSMARQRRGRAGRKAPGLWFPLYTRELYDKLLTDQYPEILRDDLSEFILNIMIQEQGFEPGSTPLELFADWKPKSVNLTNVDLLDMPMADSIAHGVEKLYRIGAITANSAPTKIGVLLQRFRKMSIESARMILAGFSYGVNIAHLITIAAMINYPKDKFMTRQEEKNYNDSLKSGLFSMGIEYFDLTVADDFIRMLGIFEEFSSHVEDPNLSKWCEKVGINYNSMMKITSSREEIIDSIVSIGLNPYMNYSEPLDVNSIKRCIYDGYNNNILIWNSQIKRYVDRNTHRVTAVESKSLDADSINTGNYAPKYLLYDSSMTMLNRSTNLYRTIVGYISVMDGFVSVDLGLM